MIRAQHLMKFIHNIPMIRPSSLLLILAIAWLTSALLPLQREEHEGKYEIGSISSLTFFKDKIFFLSDDDLFGFLDQKDGQLLTVYELELGEKIVRFMSGRQIVIARQKKLNIFWPYQGQYVRSYETIFLKKHPDFTNVIDYQKSLNGGLILTDKYLMQVPPAPRGTKLQDLKEKMLLEVSDPTEALFGLVHLYNAEEKKLDDILVSLLQNDKVRQVCFRRVQEKIVRQCIDLQTGETVQDVVASGQFIFVQLTAGAIVIDNKLALLERLNGRPTQYFQGLVTLGQNNQFYVPMSKDKFDLLLIQHSGNSADNFMGLKVEDTLLSVQKMTANNSSAYQTVCSIAKKLEETPRKVWSYSEDDEPLRVYVQFEEGKLACYSADTVKKTMQEVWHFTTIKAQKVASGELQAEDIEQEAGQSGEGSKQERKKLGEKVVNQNADITETIAP